MTRFVPDLEIDGERLLTRLEALAECGALTGTAGCNRLALTDADREGRDLVMSWMRDLGLAVRVDAIGNVVGVLEGTDPGPPVMTGSHIDTVRTGGRYDGCLGVLAGLEVIETVVMSGVRLPRSLAVAVFTNEEGARFAPDMLGSLVYVGAMPVESALEITDASRASVGDELERIGYRGATHCPGEVPSAFVELHIEQGPVLEREGRTIGVVTGVQGISWTELVLSGQSNHAGTTPMGLRRDPMVPAARIAVFVREMSDRRGGSQVGTVGALTANPNLVNVVPASVRMTVDLRNTDDEVLAVARAEMLEYAERVCEAESVRLEDSVLAASDSVRFDDGVVELIGNVAIEQGHQPWKLPSGAGHDAQMLARVCPTAMIFVPSRDGLSHNPAEFTEPDDLVAGANVLLHTLLRLANQP
ncbi:MAG: Zn-dependent hydrolase [Acidobacteria bacterium]|nr:Zn-dependent hydrolase [Acidobacteriota bacterium]